MSLILASASPRRSELLQQIGVAFEVIVRPVDETAASNETAEAYVARVALMKARAVAKEYQQRTVLAADTCISFNGNILTKPNDSADAKQMLAALSAQQHQVYTAVALVAAGIEQVVTVSTQ